MAVDGGQWQRGMNGAAAFGLGWALPLLEQALLVRRLPQRRRLHRPQHRVAQDALDLRGGGGVTMTKGY
jgi:hypothetical protein